MHFVSSKTNHSSGRVCERSGSSSIEEGPLDINTSGWSTPIMDKPLIPRFPSAALLTYPCLLYLTELTEKTTTKTLLVNYQHLCLYYSVMHIISMSAFILVLVSTIYKEESERYGKISMVMEKMKTLNKSKSSGTMGVISV